MWFVFLKLPRETKQKVFSLVNIIFGQKFTRNAKNGFECLKLIWSGTFAIFDLYQDRPLYPTCLRYLHPHCVLFTLLVYCYGPLKINQILVNQGVGVTQWAFSDLRFVLPGYMHWNPMSIEACTYVVWWSSQYMIDHSKKSVKAMKYVI